MNPVIVIPSYWARSVGDPRSTELGAYDHATLLDAPEPELERCLASLDQVRGVVRVVVLLVAAPTDEPDARTRVEEICSAHPGLNPLVVGSLEADVIQDALARVAPDLDGETVSLRGYGAIKNMGLAVAATLGHDVAVFLDDDEIALTPEFLVDAVYALGHMTRQDLPIVAKTGFFLNEHDSPFAIADTPVAWYDRWWNKRPLFNDWMDKALDATRISRSNVMCGGCFALHAEAFTRVGFDPYITRGEDLDYLFNLRLYGLNVWFDNQWYVAHRPPNTPSRAGRFEQDVYRWFYEVEKLETANGKIDLRQVSASSLMPYPGPWIGGELVGRVRKTAFFRALFYPEHRTYLRILTSGRADARRYAIQHASSYLKFQTYWPQVMVRLWNAADVAGTLMRASDAVWTGERPAQQADASGTPANDQGNDPDAPEEASPLAHLPEIEPPDGGSSIPKLVPRRTKAADDATPAAPSVSEAEIDAFLAEVKASAGVHRPFSRGTRPHPTAPDAGERDLESVAAELAAPAGPALPPDHTLTQWAALTPDEEAWADVVLPEDEAQDDGGAGDPAATSDATPAPDAPAEASASPEDEAADATVREGSQAPNTVQLAQESVDDVVAAMMASRAPKASEPEPAEPPVAVDEPAAEDAEADEAPGTSPDEQPQEEPDAAEAGDLGPTEGFDAVAEDAASEAGPQDASDEGTPEDVSGDGEAPAHAEDPDPADEDEDVAAASVATTPTFLAQAAHPRDAEPAPEEPEEPATPPAHSGADLSVPDLSITVDIPSFLDDPVANLAADPRRGLDPDLAPESVGYELDMSDVAAPAAQPMGIPSFLLHDAARDEGDAWDDGYPAATARGVRRTPADGWGAADYSLVDDVAAMDDPLPPRSAAFGAGASDPEGYELYEDVPGAPVGAGGFVSGPPAVPLSPGVIPVPSHPEDDA